MKSLDSVNTPSRKEEITDRYFLLLDQHLTDLVTGKATEMLELNDIARELCVSHKHLIAIIQQTKGEHPCHFYIDKIIKKSQQLLTETALPVAEIARMLTYDPSNFNKFFKKYVGQTPGKYRENHNQAI
ncbi:helix-turn-helix transcriptional regulator [Dyadobacter sp. 676]|uniref:Helix-turn-helix transcriptional regulator n=1 Tax=Dyadobacter sp. 676 TaxID=3088362 RepID=A0AAU8FIN1_9BACT